METAFFYENDFHTGTPQLQSCVNGAPPCFEITSATQSLAALDCASSLIVPTSNPFEVATMPHPRIDTVPACTDDDNLFSPSSIR